MNKLIQHLKVVHNHRKYVRKMCFKMGIPMRGLLHDISKYSIKELAISKYYNGTRSPHEVCRDELGYSPSWLYHKNRNKHHWEYWIDSFEKMNPMKMPYKYVIEMFCDRVAACKIYNKEKYTDSDALNYFLRGRERYVMHKDADELLYKLLRMLSVKGEKYTFTYIRKKILKNY